MISPGLFVKVRLPIGEAHPALMVREQALQSDQGLKKVIVLRPKDEEASLTSSPMTRTSRSWMRRASRSRLTNLSRSMSASRRTAEGFREISKGIRPGDLVVVLGMQKIRLGTNPVTRKTYLVTARPFDPEKDSQSRFRRAAAAPARPPVADSLEAA